MILCALEPLAESRSCWAGSNLRRWACAEDVDCALKNCGAPFSSQSRQHHMSPLDVPSALNSARNHPWFPIQLRLPLLFRLSSRLPITKRRCPQAILYRSSTDESLVEASAEAASYCLAMLFGREPRRPNEESNGFDGVLPAQLLAKRLSDIEK